MHEFMSVQVRETELRTTPSFLGKSLGKVKYGQQISVQEQGESWFNVTHNGKKGWIHKAALSAKKIVMKDVSDAELSASEDEITLAGKGFNKQVEEQYKERHGGQGFAWVDKAEKYTVSQKQIIDFLKKGNLQPPGRTTS